jgi:hypothetical protein
MVSFVVACNNNATTLDATTNLTTVISTDEEGVIILGDTYFQYSSNSIQNLLLMNLNITDDVVVYDLDGNVIDSDDVLVKNDFYEIKSSYVLSKESDTVEFYLEFSNMKTLVSIAVNDKEKPYIISSSLVDLDEAKDVYFQFELFSGTVKQLSSEGLSTDDYELNGNVLKVKSSYLLEHLEDTLVLNYALESGIDIVVGIISFSIDN